MKFLRILVVLIFCFQVSCVVKPPLPSAKEDLGIQGIEKFDEADANQKKIGGLAISSFVYSKRQYPFEEFLRDLKDGKFDNSLRKIDFKYYSQNFDSALLEKIIDAGYVPALVYLKNEGDAEIQFSEKNFRLISGDSSISALDSKNLNIELSKFDSHAAIRNSGTVLGVTMGFVMMALILAPICKSGSCGRLFEKLLEVPLDSTELKTDVRV